MSPEAKLIAEAIKQTESEGGVLCGRGKSGELGCYQFLPETWALFSKEVIGYLAPLTPVNEEYVAVNKIEQWLRDGHTIKQIALLWNQGHTSRCKSGVNEFGVEFDSCEYVNEVLRNLND